MRNRTFRYLAQALRILRFKLEDPMDKVGEIFGPRNWWVAPLPRKDGELVTSDDFAVALGWNHAQNATILQVALFWLLLLGIQLRVTYMGVAFLYEFVASS